jgi:hypothetical protein
MQYAKLSVILIFQPGMNRTALRAVNPTAPLPTASAF